MAAKLWSDAEKVGLFLQIIEKSGSIPWDSLTLPEGRTKKACVVMIDKEKQKLKNAREANGDVEEATPKGKKRKADGEGTPAPASGKKGKGRKKAKGEDIVDDEEQQETRVDEEDTAVKAEPEEGEVSS